MNDFTVKKVKAYKPVTWKSICHCYAIFQAELYKSTIYSISIVNYTDILCYLCIITQLVCFNFPQIYIKAHYIVKNIWYLTIYCATYA